MASIELLDIGDYYDHEKETVANFGRQSHELLSDSAVKTMLFERNLISVIHRYGQSREHADESAENTAYLSAHSVKSGVSYFAIVDSNSNEFLGQASIHDFLNLQIRPEAHKPNVLRRLIGKGITLSPLIGEDASNIDAWVKPSKNSRNQLAQAYNILTGHTENTWTTEPIDSVEANQAIQLSGLAVVLPPKYYDCEIKNQKYVPLSNLYLSTNIEREIASS